MGEFFSCGVEIVRGWIVGLFWLTVIGAALVSAAFGGEQRRRR